MYLSNAKMIAARLLTGAKMALATILGENIANNAIDSQHIASGAVDGSHLSTSGKQEPLKAKFFISHTQTNNFSASAAQSDDFGTTLLGAMQSGGLSGSDSVKGVVFTPPNNLCAIRKNSDQKPVEDSNGRDVYARITKSALQLTGTLDWTNGDMTVAGDGTSFLSELAAGDIIIAPNGDISLVDSVTSDTEFELSAAYAGETILDQTNTRNRITLSYYVMIAGVETAHTMTAQAIDVKFPESWDILGLPFGSLSSGLNWADLSSVAADHNHDSRYYQKTELNATSAPSGASLVGVVNTNIVGNGGATTVQSILENIANDPIYEELTIAVQNTIPNLSKTPRKDSSVVLFHEGFAQRYGAAKDYSVSGKAVTWYSANAGFNLEVGDTIWAWYLSKD